MNPLLAHLNPPQLAAVTLPPAHALILAGAGSGKTRVLTTRIAWLISTGQVSPPGVLAVTFTNKAAKEMQTRLAGMLPINVRGMWIGTFHGLCNRLLRAHYRDAGLPQLFQILDSADQQASVKRLLKSLNVDDEKFPPRELCHFINAQKEQGLRAAAVEAWDDWARKRVGLYEAYEAQCQREGVVDFAELLLRSYELLERNEPLRRHYQERFRHILVDEFQDTNRLQYAWLKLLAGGSRVSQPPNPLPTEGGDYLEAPKGACLFCVGDDDQSIYAFRGADIGNMADFEREFKVQNLIRLEQNYRSHGNILDAANAIIKNNPHAPGQEPVDRGRQRRADPRFRIAIPTATRRAGSSRRSRPCRATATPAPRSPCSTAATPSRGRWSTPCSMPACPIACMAACAFSSAPRSSMRWPICA